LFHLRVDTSNVLRIERATVNNRLTLTYVAGALSKNFNVNGLSSADWMHAALTWSVAADQVKAFIDGVQYGTTLTGLGTWAGSLTSTLCNLGASDTNGNGSWNGHLHHAVLYSKALTDAQIALLASPAAPSDNLAYDVMEDDM